MFAMLQVDRPLALSIGEMRNGEYSKEMEFARERERERESW